MGVAVPGRVVSLLPAATEIVCALGAEAALVGVSHECDFPESVRGVPVLTSSRLDATAGSLAIDRAVRELVRDALSLYSVDERALAAAAPDLVITQDLCEVCAVSLDDVKSAVARLSRRDAVAIISLSPTRLEHVLGDFDRVAEALGVPEAGSLLRRRSEERLRAISERAAAVAVRPRVLSVEWLEPLMLGGTWMPELIELAGGIAVGASAGAPAPTLGLDELRQLAPDVVLVKPCGFPLERTLRERDFLVRELVPRLPATTRVYVADGNAFFNRPGPRLVESVEILAACIHPRLFDDFWHKHSPAAVIAALGASGHQAR